MVLAQIAKILSGMDTGEMTKAENRIAEILAKKNLLVKEKVEYGLGEEEFYWVYSVPEKQESSL